MSEDSLSLRKSRCPDRTWRSAQCQEWDRHLSFDTTPKPGHGMPGS